MIKKAIKKTNPARYQAPDGSLLLATLGPLTDSILCFRIIIATGYPITLATNTGVYWGLSGPIQTLPIGRIKSRPLFIIIRIISINSNESDDK